MGETSKFGEHAELVKQRASANPMATVALTALLSGSGVAGLGAIVDVLRAGDEAHIVTLGNELERCEAERQRCDVRLDRCHGVPDGGEG